MFRVIESLLLLLYYLLLAKHNFLQIVGIEGVIKSIVFLNILGGRWCRRFLVVKVYIYIVNAEINFMRNNT